ncbi:MAG: Do family serine endopeptidase [Croceibacterium sp.]
MRYSYAITTALLTTGAAVSLLTGQPAGAQVAQNDAREINQVVPRAGAPASFADLTEQLQPAVVNISTRQRVTVNANPLAGTPFEGLFGNQQQPGGRGGGGQPTTREAQSLGSGFIVSAEGYVVTNNHVIQPDGTAELEGVTVTMPDGTEYPAEVVGKDPQSDLAVLKITRREAFPYVHFGDSRHARVGDWVIAIGNPFGLGGTVTSGIVSAVYRNTQTGGAYDRYIQTDASINRGNSGGPLFDMQGNVIGINNAIFSPSGGSVGIGFAIPAETASPIVDKLISGEEIQRGYLGIRLQPVTDEFADALGIQKNHGEFIQQVVDGEPAARAGLKEGDVVMKVNGQDVTPQQSLSFLVANIAPGSRVDVQLLRDGETKTLPVTVGRRPSEDELAAQTFNPDDQSPYAPQKKGASGGLIEQSLGLAVTPLTPQFAAQLGMNAATQGLLITDVDPNSDAAAKGLSRGTVILSAQYRGRRVTTTTQDLEAVVNAAKAADGEAILLRVRGRGSPELTIDVRLNH